MLVSSRGCQGGGGVALCVGQPQRFLGAGLLQQEARHQTEASPGSEMQESLLRVRVWRGEARRRTLYTDGAAASLPLPKVS